MDCFIDSAWETLKLFGSLILILIWFAGMLVPAMGMWQFFFDGERNSYDDPRSALSKTLWRIGAVLYGFLYITTTVYLKNC